MILQTVYNIPARVWNMHTMETRAKIRRAIKYYEAESFEMQKRTEGKCHFKSRTPDQSCACSCCSSRVVILDEAMYVPD
jgi:hypothetical protein